MNPMAKARGLSLPFHASLMIPETLPDETIGRMTSAHYQYGFPFLRGKTLVATTHMVLLMYKLLLPPGGECLSTIRTSILLKTSIELQRST
jgi:hypothetical protein